MPTLLFLNKIDRAGADDEARAARGRVRSDVLGTLRVRDRVPIGPGRDGKVIALALFAHGPAEQRQSVSAGAIAKVWGLREIHIGERIGVAGTGTTANEFPPPTLESVVDAVDPDDHAALHVALAQLAE